MKVLIIGAKGNLGSELKKAFSKEEVFAFDKDDLDITVEESLREKINSIRPDVIINAAAYNAVDKAEEDFDKAMELNGEVVKNLADIALRLDALLIHYSSDYVFGGKSGEEIREAKENGGFSEEDEPIPGNKYAESKLEGERNILKYRNNGLKYYIIRTSKLFGPKGESEASKPSFFDIMLKLSKEQDELRVVNEEISCFTYTKDLAQASKDLVTEDKPYGIYHIINQGACTWYEAAKVLFEILGAYVKITPVLGKDYPRPAKRPEYSVLRNTKLKPLRDYKEALKEYLASRSVD